MLQHKWRNQLSIYDKNSIVSLSSRENWPGLLISNYRAVNAKRKIYSTRSLIHVLEFESSRSYCGATLKYLEMFIVKFASLTFLLSLFGNIGEWEKGWNVINYLLKVFFELKNWHYTESIGRTSSYRQASARSRSRVCTNPRIANGGVMPMFKGKMIKFNCNKGFSRYGDEYAECMNGRWSIRTFPICISEWTENLLLFHWLYIQRSNIA